MKFNKKMLIAVLVIVQIISLLPCGANASTTSKARKAYKRYISAHKVYDDYHDVRISRYYKIVDISGDKVPELLFVNWKDLTVEVWTFRGGKMRSMFKDDFGKEASFAYKKSKHQVAVIYRYASGRRMNVYKTKKTELKRIKTEFDCGYESKRDKVYFKINGRRVSEKKFKKTWNKFTFIDSSFKF